VVLLRDYEVWWSSWFLWLSVMFGGIMARRPACYTQVEAPNDDNNDSITTGSCQQNNKATSGQGLDQRNYRTWALHHAHDEMDHRHVEKQNPTVV
jgi:hypothetical protein